MKLNTLIIISFLLLSSCSETYQDYLVDLDVNFSIFVENEEWEIDEFSITEVENKTEGDTATYSCIKIQAIDESYPYPKKIETILYFDKFNNSFELSSQLSDLGLVQSVVLSEIDLSYEHVLYQFVIDTDKVFSPTLTVFEYDMKRNLITAKLEGSVYDSLSLEERRFKVSFENIKIDN